VRTRTWPVDEATVAYHGRAHLPGDDQLIHVLRASASDPELTQVAVAASNECGAA